MQQLVVGYMVLKDGMKEGTDPDDISNYAGLRKRAPITAFCLLIFMFALAGIPPTAGYIGKFVLFGSAINAGLVWLRCWQSSTALCRWYYYLRIISYMYLEGASRPEDRGAQGIRRCPDLDNDRGHLISASSRSRSSTGLCRQQQFCCLTNIFFLLDFKFRRGLIHKFDSGIVMFTKCILAALILGNREIIRGGCILRSLENNYSAESGMEIQRSLIAKDLAA